MGAVQDDLVFDVGMYMGEDTAYYLARGFRVVGIDADPNMIAITRTTFSKQLTNNRLTLLNFAVSDKENEVVDFFLSEDAHYNSLRRSMSEYRGTRFKRVIEVKSRTLPSLINEYGLPYYCKIDVQGYEAVLLETLSPLEQLPPFMSVEADCCGDLDTVTEEQALQTLEQLHRLGYRKFKLVDQRTLTVLRPANRFYGAYASGRFSRVADLWFRKLYTRLRTNATRSRDINTPRPFSWFRESWFLNLHRRVLSFRLGYGFQVGSSGPFGNDLESEWLGYEAAKETLLYHRRDYIKSASSGSRFPSNGFWCDWHSKLE